MADARPDLTELRLATAAFADWLTGAALPLWCGQGYAGPGRGFIDEFDRQGRPILEPHTAVLVQARQIYVYSHAALLGWPHGLAAAGDALRLVQRHGWAAGGGWVRGLWRAGGVVDPSIDLYDNAFMLLALAWFARATGDAATINWAHRTLDAIEARMRLGGTPGFANSWPEEAGPRLQNPHMHLLEAMLALHETTGEARFAAAARTLVALFQERLFDPATGTLAEYYGPAWQRLPEAEPGRVTWPGHHCEWVWLLYQARARLGVETRTEAAALHAFAERHGVDAGTGLLRYAVTEQGVPLDRTIRLWPQTEALKAALMMLEHEGQGATAATRILHNLLRLHLGRSPRGTWTETYDAAGRPIAGRIASTSLYHIMVAYAELRRVMGQNATKP